MYIANRVLAVVISLVTTSLVFADQPESVDESFDDFLELSLEDLMDIKVTVASLFEESALDVASSVSVITQEDWEARGSRRISDVLEAVPSVHTTTTWGGGETIAIRGYATELSVRGVAFSLDGVPLNSYVYAATAYDKAIMELDFMDRIEMIRGPGSALYGTDAFHGVVSYNLEKDQGDYLKTRTALGDPLYQQGSMTSGWQSGLTQVNFGLAYRKEDNHQLAFQYTDPIDGSENESARDQGYENSSAYLSLTNGELEQGIFTFKAFANQFNANEYQGIGTQFFQTIPDYFDVESTSLARQGDITNNDSDFILATTSYEQSLSNDVIVHAQAYYWESHQDWEYDSNHYPTELTTLNGVVYPCKSTLDTDTRNPVFCPHTIYQSADEDRLGANLRVKQDNQHLNTQWLVGLGYDRQSVNDSRVHRITPDGFTRNRYDNPYQGDSRNIRHLIFQAKTGFMDDALHLVYGVRWDDYSDVGSHTSPRLGAIYTISPSLTTKLMYGHAFRAPTAIERDGSQTTVLQNENLKPETIDTYEWALIHSTKHHQTELVVFTSDWDKAIALIPSGQGTSNIYKNVNNNKAWGVELTHTWLINQWSTTLNASYVESENETDGLDYEGFPSVITNLGVQYQFTAFDGKVGLWQRAMWNYTEGDPTENCSPDDARDYYRTDLHYQHRLNDQIEIFTDVSNLFDRDNTLPSYYGSENGLLDYGRVFNIGAEISWF
ncbi:TonB-dependent receptor plug domain-containing protein [Litoribrevibacter albus]|uniref:Receptor n=1 Tax=Litoribrevibacter albus TaxID=1473156 RepID=A0AA37S877_9GAMM|nr:TonB-dependent receptor [Litoribrevibacter albus]GLQ30170.1 receptor [Litoribrevibacter albus]